MKPAPVSMPRNAQIKLKCPTRFVGESRYLALGGHVLSTHRSTAVEVSSRRGARPCSKAPREAVERHRLPTSSRHGSGLCQPTFCPLETLGRRPVHATHIDRTRRAPSPRTKLAGPTCAGARRTCFLGFPIRGLVQLCSRGLHQHSCRDVCARAAVLRW